MKRRKHQQCLAEMMILALMTWHGASFPAYSATASHTQFKPGEIWTDTSGAPINAQGGGILHYDKVYYWFGEIKTGKTWLPVTLSGKGFEIQWQTAWHLND